jgi:hypothetical protein
MQLKAIRVAPHPGYDRVTFEFVPFADRPSGMPPYELTQQPSTRFVKDPSGQPVTLMGTAGLKAVFRNSSGQGTYPGSTDLKPSTASVAELAQLGDFERVLTWGVGLNRPSCYRTLELNTPTRLAIDFQT